MIIVTRVAQFIQRLKLWWRGARSIILATLGHASTTRHTSVIFLMSEVLCISAKFFVFEVPLFTTLYL
jgi:hypothetical protein